MKVLIVSHNVIGLDGSMGKTLCSYFRDWASADLCQIYFHSEVPTTHLCEQYYRVTDVDLVNALRFRKPGRVLTREDIQEDRATTRVDAGTTAKVYQAGRRRTPLMIFARNALWGLGAWKTKELDAWMERQKPDVIFFASGDYVFAYRVVQYLAQKYHLPVVVNVVDDFYFYRGPYHSPLAFWNTRVFRSTMERMMKTAEGALYIHPAMEKAYGKVFGRSGQVLYKTAERFGSLHEESGPLRISYLGALGMQRDQVLVEMGRLLLRLIPDGSVMIDVYSGESRPEILKHMTESNGIRMRGAVSAEEVLRVEAESSILILPESRDPATLGQLRYSLSTKVPEYLASGRCVLAYGPAEAGTLSYLLENQAACVATSPAELEEKLREILFSPEKRQAYAAGQLAVARQHHTQERNSAVLREVLENAVKEDSR